MKNKSDQKLKKNETAKMESSINTFIEEYASKLEQKFVTQSHQLQTITDNAASCLFLLDAIGRPTFMNPAAEKITGYKLEEVQDKVLHSIMHHKKVDGTPNPIEDCPINNAVRDLGHVKDYEDYFIKKDGSFFPVSYSVASLESKGKPQGAVLEFQDITKRKELERQKDDFIGVASHELKTPVTSIKAYTQVLKLRFKKNNDARSVELVDKMDFQLDKLTNLIGDLLDATKLEGDRLQFREAYFDFNKLVNEIIEEVQITSEKHKIRKHLSSSKTVFADRERIGQVITNLLTNAIKYSPHSKEVIVSTSYKNGEVKLCVQDFGVGIPQSKQDKVFERFYRISGPKEDTYPGIGLGLYISSEIIKRENGRIWVESIKGKGSTFCFCLPHKAKRKAV